METKHEMYVVLAAVSHGKISKVVTDYASEVN